MSKILFAAARWDYKDPRRGDSFEYSNFWDTLRRMNGVEATLFSFDEVESQFGRMEMNRRLKAKVEDLRPDLVFLFMYQDEFDRSIIEDIGKIAPTMNWFADDQWRFHTFSRHWASSLTWIATTYPPAAEEYRRRCFTNVLLTQWACNHYLYGPRKVERDIEASFVGQPHGGRRQVIESLRRDGVDIKTWGQGWDAGRVSVEQMILIFSRSRVNLNLSNASLDRSLRNLGRIFLQRKGRFVLPRLASVSDQLKELRDKRRDQIKGRNFEIPGCRALLLTPVIEGLDKYFVPGKEVVTFGDYSELLDRMRYFLQNHEELEEIAKAGYVRTLSEHTYELRFRSIFERIGLM